MEQILHRGTYLFTDFVIQKPGDDQPTIMMIVNHNLNHNHDDCESQFVMVRMMRMTMYTGCMQI